MPKFNQSEYDFKMKVLHNIKKKYMKREMIIEGLKLLKKSSGVLSERCKNVFEGNEDGWDLDVETEREELDNTWEEVRVMEKEGRKLERDMKELAEEREWVKEFLVPVKLVNLNRSFGGSVSKFLKNERIADDSLGYSELESIEINDGCDDDEEINSEELWYNSFSESEENIPNTQATFICKTPKKRIRYSKRNPMCERIEKVYAQAKKTPNRKLVKGFK